MAEHASTIAETPDERDGVLHYFRGPFHHALIRLLYEYSWFQEVMAIYWAMNPVTTLDDTVVEKKMSENLFSLGTIVDRAKSAHGLAYTIGEQWRLHEIIIRLIEHDGGGVDTYGEWETKWMKEDKYPPREAFTSNVWIGDNGQRIRLTTSWSLDGLIARDVQ